MMRGGSARCWNKVREGTVTYRGMRGTWERMDGTPVKIYQRLNHAKVHAPQHVAYPRVLVV